MDSEYCEESEFAGKPIVPFENVEKSYPPDMFLFALPMGMRKLNKIREEKYLAAKAKGYTFITWISNESNCYAESIGENTFIFPHTLIQPYTKIGNNCILWPCTGVGHNCIIGENCYLASPKISGCVQLKHNCFLGTNTTIGDTLSIGEYSVIGAGAIVTRDIPAGSVLAVKQTSTMPVASWDMEDILG
ncbi:MAG: acetyltransferase [Prevotella sp.]|nr:acetyltransferase [Prevotella sp.]